MQGDIVTYDYFGGLYINMTNRCDCHCVFCIRDQEASALGGLWLQEEPAKEAVLAEILAQDLGQYTEIVFCGYGEPTCRADDLFWLCDQLRAAGRADLPPIRLNTNGHGSLINHRDITPELKGRLDAVSVSLNGSNREEYLRLTRPGAGEKGWQAMLDFVRQAVQYVPKVMVSIVDYDKSPQEMEACRRLAEELGARIATVYGDDTPLQIAEYARASGVTKIVLGRSNNKRFFWERSKNLVDRLNALAPDLDIHIIPDTYPAYRAPRKSWNLSERFTVKDALRTLVILAVCTMVGLAFAYLDFSEANIIMIYQLGVLVVAMVTSGRLYSLAASILSILIFNFFFTVPLFTFHFNDKSYLATFLVMFLVAFLSSSLTTRIKRQARLASRQAYRTQVLLEASQTLQKAEGQEAILEAMAVQLRKLLERTALYYPVLPDGTLGQPRFFPVEPTVDTGAYLGPDETAVASWVQKNNKHAGATTNTLPNAKCLYLAVRGEGSALAVAGIAIEEGREPDAFEKNLMIAILGECGLSQERIRVESEQTWGMDRSQE